MEDHTEENTKRLFPFKEDSVINEQTKRLKTYSTQVSNSIEETSAFKNSTIKYSNEQACTILDKENILLAEKMRPTNIANYIGQRQVVGPETVLYHLLSKGEIPSMIFWGPPGCGKTSLTNVIACLSKETMGNNIHIVNLSAADCGVKNVKDAVTAAKNKSKFDCKTIVFMDKIHCFNKLQQDIFLPHVEAGTFILIGCTTENPSYSLNPALLSRCRVFVLSKLTECNVIEILYRAIEYMNGRILDTQEGKQIHDKKQMRLDSNFTPKFYIDNTSVQWLAEACDGDAHIALNTLELAMLTKLPNALRILQAGNCTITLKVIKESLKQAHILSEKDTNQSHHIYSALQKSIRAGKPNASLYWLARIMAAKEDPVNIARRLVRISSEDIGLADPDALGVAVHTMHGCQMIGMPESDVLLAQCTLYLTKAPKSRLIYNALQAALKVISEHKGPQPTTLSHVKCNSLITKLQDCGRNLSEQKDYSESYSPKALEHTNLAQED